MTLSELLKRRTPQPGGGCAPRTYGRREGGGSGEVRADLGSHKPVCVGKRRPESTASIRSSNNPVTVIDYANSNHNPNHNHNPNPTNANGVDSARLLSLSYASALTQCNGPAVAWTQSRDRDGSAWGLRVEMQFNATPVEGSCDVYRR